MFYAIENCFGAPATWRQTKEMSEIYEELSFHFKRSGYARAYLMKRNGQGEMKPHVFLGGDWVLAECWPTIPHTA